ncbi:hypothetical protein POVCU2_0074800 [Plasmodium ovale curtisi]|uniref:Uncharacterized protein n=1 Tax=Plasmodium ovale curtisi TaxID=864141 RepID=A0A1A8WL06_PLAOA|nr:hypothetical protein POVCU2_0074800 [Plasmodium ovale curtisi]SBS99208.1 hypothetical protein POVCU1_051330 [Plasmodium ovale curtisi]
MDTRRMPWILVILENKMYHTQYANSSKSSLHYSGFSLGEIRIRNIEKEKYGKLLTSSDTYNVQIIFYVMDVINNTNFIIVENKGSSKHHNYSIGHSCRTDSNKRLCSACNLNDVHTTESNIEKIYRFRYTEIILLMT